MALETLSLSYSLVSSFSFSQTKILFAIVVSKTFTEWGYSEEKKLSKI